MTSSMFAESDFNPLSPEFDANPFPEYVRLRDQGLYRWEAAGAWVVTRYDQYLQILRDAENFSPDRCYWEHYEEPADIGMPEPVQRLMEINLFASEGKEHARLRRLVSRGFTPRAVAAIEPEVSVICDERLEGFVEKGEVELVSEYASVVPVTVISRMLGIPPRTDRELEFKRMSEVIVQSTDPFLSDERRRASWAVQVQFLELVGELMEERRREPRDDMLTALVQAGTDDDVFGDDEILSTITALLVAGSETTANVIALGMLDLLRHPDQLALYREHPELRANAVEEILRRNVPGKFLWRYAKRDVDFGGERVRKGEMLFISIAAAHRDPEVFSDPDRFDVTRDARLNSVFGNGPHYCIGASLAKLELQVALSALIDRLQDLRLIGDRFEYNPHLILRSLKALPLRFRVGST